MISTRPYPKEAAFAQIIGARWPCVGDDSGTIRNRGRSGTCSICGITPLGHRTVPIGDQ